MLERIVVRDFIYPALLSPHPPLSCSDQYAFRPTGSTTATLISILHTITNLLDTNPYVIVTALYFSKVFDSVRHATLTEKYATLDIPDNIYCTTAIGRRKLTKCQRGPYQHSDVEPIQVS